MQSGYGQFVKGLSNTLFLETFPYPIGGFGKGIPEKCKLLVFTS
jgi:hypothetical protein